MRIGVPRESRDNETLVAATAKTAGQLVGLGYEVVVESGAGVHADQTDEAYREAGAQVGSADDVWGSDVVVKVNAPTEAEIGRLRRGATVVALMAPGRSPELLERLQGQGVTALAMDAVPRISRAQSMDVLSSMANVAGYRAVIEAAHVFNRQFTGQVTAAGKVPPAKVFVVGAGVAGLAAIGAAGSMGAVVRAFDLRPEVGEQVESMGAQFVKVEMESEAEEGGGTGYAKEMTQAQQQATAEMYAAEAANADIVITTALIPGRPAPKLITADAVSRMANGSVVVDLAAANGGNCELTEPNEKRVTDNGVTILGYTDLPSRLPAQTSQLYGTNIVNLFKLLTPDKDGRMVLDLEDQVVRGLTAVKDGEDLWPPPEVKVSNTGGSKPVRKREPKPEPEPSDPRKRLVAAGLGAVAFAAVASVAPAEFLGHFTVFALAVFVGFYVISNVAHALHTPLMSETNAISGIILVGGILQVGRDNTAITVLAVAAVLVASINIFGGFLVTSRMLGMFRKD